MSSPYEIAVELLRAGAFIEQISESPQIYELRAEGDRLVLPGGLVQQLLAHRAIRRACLVSGRARFVAA